MQVRGTGTRDTFRHEALPVAVVGSRASAAIGQPVAVVSLEGQRASARAAVAGGSSLFLHSHFDNKRPPGMPRRRPPTNRPEPPSGRKTTSAAGWLRSPDLNLMSSSGDDSSPSRLQETTLMGG
ncbi:hypothetical protein LI328DRAFT_146712 [Trichoderma asperelloides]|nr:hypothetical protein LI328DRAFT_146712 [Trichoderma asperelloides]